MQDPNEDTEWNDILRAKGIIPQKEKEITEEDLVDMVESTIESKNKGKEMGDMNRDELDELEDEIDEDEERVFEEYRRQRMQELHASRAAARYGSVLEISKADWVTEINKAPEDVWVVVHIYSDGIPLCKLMNQHLSTLSSKFPCTKFVRGRASVCIEGYPERNVPTLFVYRGGKLTKQWVGALQMQMDMKSTQDDLEWLLSQSGAIQTELTRSSRQGPEDAMDRAMKAVNAQDDDDNDW